MNLNDQLKEEMHLRVMRLLEQNPSLTQRELAASLGVSLGSVNYCLRALVQRGHVKLENFRRSEHKPGYLYLLTPQGVQEKARLTARFLRRKVAEYEALKAEIEGLKLEVGELGVDAR